MSKDNIKNRLKELPEAPGVYLMKDSMGKIIYVGKAKVLKNRVRSYFQKNLSKTHRAATLMQPFVEDIEWIVAGSELEALILEANLVQKHQPKFNVRLKDDKHYPYLKVTIKEPFPRVLLVRKVLKDGAKYYGPYTNVRAVRRVMEMIPKLFRIRECDFKLPSSSEIRPCLAYHIKRCDAPCDNLCTVEEYKVLVDQVLLLLEGKHKALVADWTTKMQSAVQALEYEKAAEFRDHIQAVQSLGHRQQVDLHQSQGSMDLFVVARSEELATLVVLEYREGILLDRKQLSLDAPLEQSVEEILEEFLLHYYSRSNQIPEEIYLEQDVEDNKVLEMYLSGLRGKPVQLIVPKVGPKQKALRLARKNAEMLLVEDIARKAKNRGYDESVSILKRELKLEVEPRYIIAFDISHLSGTGTVASMVVFRDGRPAKGEYRKFNIKTVEGIDDYASMREVLDRRLRRTFDDNLQLPDLILIDGGKGQVEAAWSVVLEYGLVDQQLCGLAKRLEEVWFPRVEHPVFLPRKSHGLRLLQRLRDESHRFAITFQRNKRKENLQGMQPLIGLAGIGPATRTKLIQKFQTMDLLLKASLEDVENCLGKSKGLILWEHLERIR